MNLVLFFTRSVSLNTWDEVGMLDREVALYERLRDRGVSVSFVTYGGASELDYASRIPGIQILCNRWGFPNRAYEKILHRFHGKALKSADLIKTNQMNGADLAFQCARFWRKCFIARCGYMWSQFVENENGSSGKIHQIESEVFRSADKIVVTTDEMKKNIANRFPQDVEKTLVIPNYVETNRFTPDPVAEKEYDLIFVGRLAEQKNIESLLLAVQTSAIRTLVIGNGPLISKIQEAVTISNGKISWLENVPNSDLPSLMNRARIFILPSHYEGHPKTLIEAMSCGMPVIGADSPGIREIIDHGVNGHLCSTDPESIRSAVKKLLANPDLCTSLGENAYKYAVENFSLERILEMEYKLYMEILHGRETKALN